MDQENTVATPVQQDDAAEFPQVQEEETPSVTLDEVLGDGKPVEEPQDDAAPQAEAEPTEPEKPADTQKDIDKAIGQRLHAERERMQRQFDQQFGEDLKLAQLAKKILGDKPQERLLQAEAREYAQKNNVNETVAMDIVRYKHGLPIADQTPAPQARDENGRFTKAQNADPARQRAQELSDQARAIQEQYGENVVEILQSNPDMLERVKTGEWDINAAYINYLRQGNNQRPRVPGIPKSGAHSSVRKSISNMSDTELEKLERAVRNGARVQL